MLLLLDKDGTLVKPKSGAQFVNAPTDQEPLPSVIETLTSYSAKGAGLVIISNQGGIAAGHKSLESAIAEMRFCLELFPQIKEAYFCPDFEGEECCWCVAPKESRRYSFHELSGTFRKPNPEMLLLAVSIFKASQGLSLMVGDCPEDKQAATAANVPFQLATDFFNQEEK